MRKSEDPTPTCPPFILLLLLLRILEAFDEDCFLSLERQMKTETETQPAGYGRQAAGRHVAVLPGCW